jgi:2-methylcitrate dehydratase PrpD
MNMLDILVDNVLETHYENLPTDAVEATRKQVLDILAAIIGGSTCSLSGELEGLVAMVKDWGGKEESSIIAFGGRVPAHNAAFINGVLATQLDFDDTFAQLVRNHPSRSIVPTALAIGERQGNINGKQLITAIALGHDLECRLKLGVGHDFESPMGFVTNFIGAAATAGKLLGLKKNEMKNTLSLAFHQVSGAKCGIGSAGAGASIKGISTGLMCQSGITSALLAEKGFSSNWDFLDISKKKNLYDVFYGGSCVPPLIIQDLGKVFMGTKSSLKEFPCCHGQHPVLEATLDLIKKHGIQSGDVEKIQLSLSPIDVLLLADPLEKKQNPENRIETQFSLCWGVASAIVYGKVEIRNFTKEALEDKDVREIARKVYATPDIKLAGSIHSPCKVEIKTKSGKVYAMTNEHAPLGSPDNPLSFSFIADKFRQCCEYSIRPLPDKNRNTVIDLIEGLEEVNDAGEIVRLLAD